MMLYSCITLLYIFQTSPKLILKIDILDRQQTRQSTKDNFPAFILIGHYIK